MIEFDKIKREIQRYTLSSILHLSFDSLNFIQRNNDNAFPYWNILSLIRWAYQHTTDSKLRKKIKPEQFDKLLRLTSGFESGYSGMNFRERTKVDQSFKIIAFQQFSLHEAFHPSLLSRQLILYFDLRAKFDIDKAFEKITGINLKAFICYNYFTYLFSNLDMQGSPDIPNDGILPGNYFILFKTKWTETELKKYLELLSLNSKEDFIGLQKLTTEVMQLYENNSFTKKPFILFRNQYRLPYRPIFVQTIKHFIYDYLKTACPSFSEEFGYRLEKYIVLGLTENNIPFLNDTDLKTLYKLGKNTDYLIQEEILIEVKAIELHPRSGVTREKERMIKEFNGSIIKAYGQLLSTANIIDPCRTFWGIVITYKEMYLGFGADTWKEFLQEPIEKFCVENNIAISILPPENLFFMTVEDWDKMMQAIKSKNVSLKEILMMAQQANANTNVSEKLGMMNQVLHQHFSTNELTLAYLKDRYKELDILPDKQSL